MTIRILGVALLAVNIWTVYSPVDALAMAGGLIGVGCSLVIIFGRH